MDLFSETYKIDSQPKTEDDCTFIKDGVRISVLTSKLLRLEKQPDGKFCDKPTQAVLNRNFSHPSLIVTDNIANFAVKTDDVSFIFDSDCNLIQTVMKNSMTCSDFHKGNLMGTRRTLDMTSGKVSLEEGILSRNGTAIMDDSETLIICSDGTIKPRKDILGRSANGTDQYIFAYGHDYEEAIKDLYNLTGHTPLIPRFTLGNWWSRYKAYTQEEYLDLMKRFIDEEIPITVATVDMDWHWVNVVDKFGPEAAIQKKPKNPIDLIKGVYINPGWSGYSWNTDLFPDYKKFLKTLKDENFKVTLNLHPASGVRFFEDMYEDFAKYMGIDTKSKQQIEFDITDKKFIDGYFKYLHNGYEQDGVDFWWIDWQQEKYTKIPGLDPLWALNHYHSLNIARNGKKRPLILSRYAGVGSHRYPLGFSGDTSVTWKTLDFQPYFTANASNVGYSWWSHDIGGHHLGKRDDELYIRWLQFGVFSPIMRLHSTSNEFLGKEPWKFSREAQNAATESLRFRHRLIPYIYTMNRRTQKDGLPLCEPMYYKNSEDNKAYNVPNEYYFGSELIAAPITKPVSRRTRTAYSSVWLPEGRFTDIFTGRIYSGNKEIKMFRDTSSIPVLAKEGAIIPLSVNNKTNDSKNPSDMEIYIYRGNGKFNMYEDDGETMNFEKGEFAETLFEINEKQEDAVFTVYPPTGDISVLPKERNYTISFKDISYAEKVTVTLNGKKTPFAEETSEGEIKIYTAVKPQDKLKITLKNITPKKNPPKKELLTELFSKVQGNNNIKNIVFSYWLKKDSKELLLPDNEIRYAVEEIFAMTE